MAYENIVALLHLSKSKNMKIRIFTIIKLRLSNQHPEDTATGIVGKNRYENYKPLE